MSLRIAVLPDSDTRILETDTSGALLAARLGNAGHVLAARELVRDDRYAIRALLSSWIASSGIDAVLISGGTGITARDVTVEAVRPLLDKEIDGSGELFRWLSYDDVGTSTIQSRALGGIANRTLIFCLPGSTRACELAWDKILAAQLSANHKPCNFVELIPRL